MTAQANIHLIHTQDWQEALQDGFADVNALLEFVDLPKTDLPAPTFSQKIPRIFAQKITKGDWHDPILRQFLPTEHEDVPQTGYVLDPLAERAHSPVPGLLHKYKGRVLITPTGACAVHCRYCFRRHYDYSSHTKQSHMAAILDYIRADSSIFEVILSGGDPLSLSNARLSKWLDALEDIDHISTIRMHTRTPVVLPMRLDASLQARLNACTKSLVMVLHTNHPNEVDDTLKIHLEPLKAHLLNQSVLLKGINDDADTLVALSYKLFKMGVMPYYLHMLDKVQGSAHFQSDVDLDALYQALLERLPGYLVPKIVQELPFVANKTPFFYLAD